MMWHDLYTSLATSLIWKPANDLPFFFFLLAYSILQEPTSLMLGGLHLTMSKYFDMDEILSHLVTDTVNRGKTRAYVNRAFEADNNGRNEHIRNRSFLFVFKYYTEVGDGLEPAPWQKFDRRPPDKRSQDHIDIAECSSVLALSLSGQHVREVEQLRRFQPPRKGYIFDTFAPWHLLNIQSYPDNEHTVRGSGYRTHFYSGPYAFLDALVLEYRDATRRNQTLHDRITKLISPQVRLSLAIQLIPPNLRMVSELTYIYI
jgi:hypothetical protein